MFFCIDDEKLQEKYKSSWTSIKNLKDIELNALPVYDARYIKIKIRTYGDKVYTNFCGLNVQKDDIECESFTIISIFACIRKQILLASIFRQLCL